MLITNNYNLPQTIVEAVKKWTFKPKEMSIGVTSLIGSPMVRHLQLKHWDELVEDASDRLWALLGQAMHSVLDKVDIEETLSEEKLVITLEGYDIDLSGRPDLYNGIIEAVEDYKVTSVYSFLLGDKPEWVQQLNVYAWMYRQHGFNVSKLTINAMLRDWMKSRLLKDADYPKKPFIVKSIPLWTEEKQKQFIYDRIAIHMAEPIMCTDEEKWYRGEKFAVKKVGNKTAMRGGVQETLEGAEAFISKQDATKKYEIEHRKGTCAKCLDYCNVADFCEFGKTLKEDK